tara:strand:- start:112 stop:540 length:429 start_codon:yes stop_codon:yes gene_type:complete
MTYATQNDLIDRVGERLLVDLTDREDARTNSIDADAVAQALAHADAEIDGYLVDRYVLPLTEVPPTVIDIACILAIWRLHTYEPSAKIKSDHEEAQRKLREIRAGTFRLPVNGVEPTGTGGSGARVTDRERPFTEDTMKSFI